MLINLRNALMAGKRLPYDAEVEYLQSSGTQYIDTLVNADSNLSVEITMANAGTPWANVNPTGVILATPRHRHHLNFDNHDSQYGVVYYLGNGDYCFASSGYRPTDGEIFTFKVDAIIKTFTVGSYLGTFPNNTFDTGLSYWLFGRNGTTPPYLGALRIYSAKLWNGTTLVRDYIPVRVGTVGYLYDRVSGKLFGNEGSGDFVLGPDVVPVEYLQSSGRQYIDTGVVGYKTTKVESHCALLNASSGYPAMWGARTGSRNNDFQIYYNTSTIGGNPSSIVLRTGNSDKSISTSDIGVNTFIGTRLDIVAADGALSVNGYNFSTPAFSNFTTPHSILMFCEYTVNSPANFGSFVYWGMKMWQADSIVRSFLPVRVGTDATSWEGAMMDVLTRRIYRNAGTGAFTYGNDLKYPIPAA